HDLPDLLAQAPAVARDRHDDGAVEAAEASLLDRPADHRSAVRDDGLDEYAVGPRALELEHLVARRREARRALEVDDGVDDPHEVQPVPGLQRHAVQVAWHDCPLATALG